ncbi:MAG: hypothetical protein LUJ09_04155 [Firmicutes bacterium]|nr:hypothetical protein [Bacillota bacterium]
MAKWECPNRAEAEMAAEMGLDPDAIVVNRVGTDYLVFLDTYTRRETIVPLYRRETNAQPRGRNS